MNWDWEWISDAGSGIIIVFDSANNAAIIDPDPTAEEDKDHQGRFAQIRKTHLPTQEERRRESLRNHPETYATTKKKAVFDMFYIGICGYMRFVYKTTKILIIIINNNSKNESSCQF